MSSCNKTVSGSLHAEMVTVRPNGVASANLCSTLARYGSRVTWLAKCELGAAPLGCNRTEPAIQ